MQFHCNECDHQSLKWLGCCPRCNNWNTFQEVKEIKKPKSSARPVSLKPLTDISSKKTKRLTSGISEWDRVMGGGIVAGSFMILTGDPGIGKSTLLLQVAHHLGNKIVENRQDEAQRAGAQRVETQSDVLYFSSEESLEQVKSRAERLDCLSDRLLFGDQANIDEIIATAIEVKPKIIIIDSIQNCYTTDANTTPGSVSQLRESAFKLMRLAKEQSIAVILTGHITKDGQIAGPRTLEHMVDAVFYLQGEDRFQTRILRSVKNRFGAINEIGFFQMAEKGLKEVPNINEHLLEDITYSPGSSLISYIEGSRPLLIELQALTISAQFGMPQRVVSGIDQKQVVLIAAILEKYLKVKLSSQDLFFKISGGFKIKASSADLGIALALLSSFFQKPLPEKSLALGEISLTGHIKPVNFASVHIKEAEKFGMKTLLLPAKQKSEKTAAKVIFFKHVYELLTLFE